MKDAQMTFTDGTNTLASVAGVNGAFAVSASGVAGEAVAHVLVNLTGLVHLDAGIKLAINTTSAAVHHGVTLPSGDTVQIDVRAGPFFRLEATAVQISILSQSLSGNFIIEKTVLKNGDSVLVFIASDVSVSLTTGSVTLSLTKGSGAFALTRSGMAGTASGVTSLTGVNSLTLSATLTFTVNTGITLSETIDGHAFQYAAASPFFRIAGSATVGISGFVDVSGSFYFEKATDSTTASVIRIGASQVSAFLGVAGTAGLSLTDGSLAMMISGNGTYAVDAKGTVDLVTSGNFLAVSGALAMRINTTGRNDINETIDVDGTPLSLTFGAGEEHVRYFSGTSVTLTTPVVKLSGSFAFENDGASNDILAAGTDITFFAGNPAETLGVRVDHAEFALLIHANGTYAFHAHGAAAVVGVPDFTFTGDLSAEQNTTGSDINRSITVGNHTVSLTIEAGVSRLGADHVTLNTPIGSLTGNFAIVKSGTGADTEILMAATNVDLFVGNDAKTMGVLVSNADLVVLVTKTGYAFDAGGTAQVVGVTGLTLSGNLGMQRNTLGVAVDRSITVGGVAKTLTLASGISRFGGDNVVMALLGQTLTGSFAVSNSGSDVTITVTSVHIGLGDGTNELVRADIAAGTLTMSGGELTGTLTNAVLTTEVTGLSFSGTFNASIDTATSTFSISGGSVSTPVSLTVTGQTLSGVFVIEGKTTAKGDKVIRITVSSVTLSLASGVVSVSDGQGAFILMGTGIAGSITGNVALNVTGLHTSATFTLDINTLNTAVNDTFAISGSPDIVLALPAGPYVKVTGKNVSVTIGETGALALTGNFSFEQKQAKAADGSNSTVTTLAVTNGAFTYSGNGITNAEGAFILTTDGLAGVISGDVAVASGAFSVGGSLGLRINSGTQAVDETVVLDGRSVSVTFKNTEIATGSVGSLTPFFQVFGANMSLKIADFITIEGSFVYTSTGAYQWFAGTGLSVFLGKGPARLENGDINPSATGVLIADATLGLIKYSSTEYALVAKGTVSLIGISQVTLSGTATVRVNNSGHSVDEVLEIPGTSSEVAVNFASAGTIRTFTADGVTLSILGQSLTGNLSFSQLTIDPDNTPGSGDEQQVIEVTADHMAVSLGGGAITAEDGEGAFMMSRDGFAGQLSVTLATDLTGLALSGSFKLVVNTMDHAAAFTSSAAQDITLAAGPYVRVSGTGVTLTILGQNLQGDFFIERITKQGGGSVTRISVSKAGLTLGAGGTDYVNLTNGSGSFVLSTEGLFGSLSATVTVTNLPGVGFAGTFGLDVNTTGSAVNESFTADGKAVSIVLPSGPYIRIDGTDLALTLMGQTLSGDLAFEKVSDEKGVSIIRLGATNIRFSISDGATDLVSLTNGQGSMILTAQGLAGELTGSVAVAVPGLTVSGSLTLQVNQTGSAVDDRLSVNGSWVTLFLPAGPFSGSKARVSRCPCTDRPFPVISVSRRTAPTSISK
jgi:hypothetical protein